MCQEYGRRTKVPPLPFSHSQWLKKIIGDVVSPCFERAQNHPIPCNLEIFSIPIFHPGKGTDPWVGREVGRNFVLGCTCIRQTCIALIACSIDKSMSIRFDSVAF
jgi:hypothetical protein